MVPQARRGVRRDKSRRLWRVSVVLTGEEYSQLSRLAGQTERSMSWLSRYAVRRLLQQHDQGQLDLPLDSPAG